MGSSAKPILSALSQKDRAVALARFWQGVDRSGGPESCWPARGLTVASGYAVLRVGNASSRRTVKAHRLSYEIAFDGACPPSVDHLCHDATCAPPGVQCSHRMCCNPRHLAAASVEANAARARIGVRADTCRKVIRSTTSAPTSPRQASDRAGRARPRPRAAGGQHGGLSASAARVPMHGAPSCVLAGSVLPS